MTAFRHLLVLLVATLLITSPAAAQEQKTVLLTGFEPFGGYAVNSSWEAIKTLEGKQIDGYTIKTVQLPVEYATSAETLSLKIREMNPDIVIGFGLVPDDCIRLEYAARNTTGKYKDNKGYVPEARSIVPNAPERLYSSLPLAEIRKFLRSNRIKAVISGDAGDFLCNFISYHLLLQQKEAGIRATGFVHLPPLDSTYTADYLNRIVEMIVVRTVADVGSPDKPVAAGLPFGRNPDAAVPS